MAQLIGHYISGKHIVETQRSGPIFNPSTGEEIAQCAYGDVITVNQAVQAATSLNGRRLHMHRAYK